MRKGSNFRRAVYLLLAVTLLSCEDFLQVDPPNSKITAKLVFTDDATAAGAMAGMYLDLLSQSSFASGTKNGIVSLAGLSSNELVNVSQNPEQLQFENNDLDAENSYILNFWASAYKTIYKANAILEGLVKSTGVTPELKKQLRGEALFIRAFCQFYLVNSFGDVPLITTVDYRQNAAAPRVSTLDVYEQILKDLQEAESLMGASYLTTGRVRPNKFAATALQARVYLYKQDWARAEEKAGNVIARVDLYNVALTPLNNVFLSTSKEAIWQIRVPDGHKYTNEGYVFGTNFGHENSVLDSAILNEFEPTDLRRTNWVTSKMVAGVKLYYPFKYKLQNAASLLESNEYSTVFRLAEQHLIRAEALARQDKLSQALADIDVVRNRAGLPLIQNTNPSISQDDLLLLIEQERRIEFMAEWGHRWLDLKRTGRAKILLGSKPGWSSDDELYPLPAKELRNNPKLTPQNPGY